MSYEMKQLVHDIRALADALCMEENKQEEIEFTHDSGFNSIQGKYSLVCDTRGLLIASEDYCEMNDYKAPTDSSDIQLRVNEFGDIVHPPEMPEPPKPIDTSKWVNITPLRREKLAKYEEDLESYEHQMEFYRIKRARWEALPLLNDGRSVEEHRVEFLRNRPVMGDGINHRTFYDYMNRVFNPEPAVLVYWAKGFGECAFTEFPRFYSATYMWFHPTPTKDEDEDCTLSEWMGELPEIIHESRGYKRNRDIHEVLTQSEQLDLFNCRTKDSGVRIVDYDFLESFGTKPNRYLANAYMDFLFHGIPLTDWQRFQLNKRMSKTVSVKEGQQTLL